MSNRRCVALRVGSVQLVLFDVLGHDVNCGLETESSAPQLLTFVKAPAGYSGRGGKPVAIVNAYCVGLGRDMSTLRIYACQPSGREEDKCWAHGERVLGDTYFCDECRAEDDGESGDRRCNCDSEPCAGRFPDGHRHDADDEP